ncbi:ABC transporter ATP-binding protein [Propioniciclava tarda]|uniref:ABC transporter ATP-binding protein n=1 Tax=Propioniciclava tarda TaxID=433330 RepID=A0A4Q9KL32_PROTD|nr:ABC transporter ATP-binding protein [Propioniciclava tarda]TBT95212.1 ABC transporter ATP-binding protein [Propioniciclava tarda]SMO52324.1 amino acid/amide ABC transporter ATP-binding protein 2, HAAT family [Propioniciclava tarda]
MLTVKDLNVHYGGIHALKGIDLNVEQGQIVSLIGANGAGKSTSLNAIMNLIKYTGSVSYKGKDVKSTKTMDLVKAGLTLAPEGRRIFPNLTVTENLTLGAYARKGPEVAKDMDWVFELFPRMEERRTQKGGTLSGGEQQMLAIGRALMSRPELMMLDEPSLGLAPLVVKDIFKIIRTIHDSGVTVLLIEQNAKAALEVADHAYVLEVGKVVLEGPGRDLLKDPRVQSAYLGE